MQANSGANELYFTIFPGTSCESRDTAILVVQDTVPVNITTPNATYCERDALDTLGASPAGGRWIGLGIVDPLVGSFEPDSLLPGSSTRLTYQFLDSLTGCLSQNTLTARLNPLPPIALGLDTTYCYTAQFQELPIANPSTGTWSGIGLVPPTQFDPIVSDTGQFTFIYTVTDANGCTNTDSITISVIEPDSISAGPDTTVCVNGGTFTLPNFFPSTGVRWTGNGITDPLTGQYDPAQAGPGIDTCIICTGSGSCTICDTTLVTVDPAPPVVALNDSMCVDGGPISLDDNGLAFGVLTLGTWSGPGVNQVGLNSYTFDTTAFGLYPIVYEHTDSISSVGCTSRDTAFVRVDSLPIAAFPTPANACVGNLISLDNTSQGANSFDWTFGANPPLPSTDSLPQITYPDTGTFTITLVAISPAGCDDTTSRTIFISEPPQPFFSKSIDSACSNRDIIPGIDGIAVDFTDLSVPAGGRYRWDFGGGRDVLGNGTFNTATPPTIFFAQGKNDTTYFIRLSIINFCDSITYLDSVKVLPIPTAIFSPDSLTSCSPYVPNWRNNTAGSADTYAWYVDDFNTIESNDSVPRNIVLTYDGTTDTTYRVYMVASNACGSDTAFQDITVVPNTVDAFFSTSVVNGCAPLEVTFISYAGTPTRSFDLGDGTTSRLDTITYIYDEPGSYVVEHFADNGCSFDTNRITIEVFPFPELAIAPRDTIVCPNQAIQFRDTTGTGNSIGYQWFFGNGDSSTATSPVYTYSAPGTYIVSTSVISTVNGCPATDTTTIIVRQPPQAEFSVSDTAGCEPLEVTFTNQSSGALGYVWDFGEGTGSTLASPSFTYDTAGTYFIQLQAFDGFGCAGLAFDTVVVYPQPVAAFSFTLDDSCGGPAIGRFQNQSTGQLLGYQWDVGFDTSILTDPEFTFPQAGTYPVSLIANNAFGCADTARDSVIIYPQPVANWTVTPTDDCEPMVVTFANTSTDFTEVLWDFGDQTSSTSLDSSQQHLYLASNGDTSYLARLIVRYEDVCVDSISQLIEVASAPNAQFIASEDSFCGAPATVSFTDQSQDFGEIVQYRWDFGDGAANQSNLVNPVHTFQDTDTFAVNLIVTNASGCRDTAEQFIYVFPQPQAVVVPDTTIGCYDFPVTFTTQDPDFGTGWQWDFGDGSQAFGKVVSHIYQFDGVFEAKVVIDHAQFCFDSATTTITVGTPPVANFSIEVDGQCDDTVRVTLTNNSVFADTYRWDFGDGRTSTEFEPALFYTFPGDYDIRLIAFNDFGCADTFVVEWEYPRAIAEFEIGLDDQRGCAPHTVRFTDESVAVTEWEWDFGDGTDPVFDQSPTHTYEIPGVYEVTLRVSFRGLCRDTFTYPAPIEVLESPTGDFIFERVSTIDPNTSDNRAIFRFTDTSPEPGESVRWNLGNGVTFSDRTFTYEYTENPPELWCDCSGPTPEDSLHQFLVTMVQSNPNGCRDTVQKWLEPQVHGLFMPNAIIPADPDTLISTFQAQAKGLCRLQFAVYNKWGNIIYEYDTEQEEVLTPDGTPTGGWRGTVNGQAVDNGVYIWRIQQAIFTGCEELLRERSDRQGTVTVIR